MSDLYSEQAIQSTLSCSRTFCKFLTANDSGETGGHQAGILVSISAMPLMFNGTDPFNSHIMERSVRISWPQLGRHTDSRFKWYASKSELRITSFGRGFELKRPEHTGSLFVLCEETTDYFTGYVLSLEDEIDEYMGYFGITPEETNRLIDKAAPLNQDKKNPEQEELERFVSNLLVDFPSSEEMSAAAREIHSRLYAKHPISPFHNPDKLLLRWTREEYLLFKTLEYHRYGNQVARGFETVDDFVTLALKVLNRRKSRAGKSLEHHIAALFDLNNIQYTAQAVTEGNKRPDFIFPSEEAYHDMSFPTYKLTSLAVKTTCKDRWRQILNEADRLRDGRKYLLTLQQGISSRQMDEMEAENVRLVVPKDYIWSYPPAYRSHIWPVVKFIGYVRQAGDI